MEDRVLVDSQIYSLVNASLPVDRGFNEANWKLFSVKRSFACDYQRPWVSTTKCTKM